MFEPLKNLTRLTIAHDQLRPEWFTGLTSLETLDFVGSSDFTSFDYIGLVKTLPALKELTISGRLTCDFLLDLFGTLGKVDNVDPAMTYYAWERDGVRVKYPAECVRN